MPFVFDAAPLSATANSYTTIDEADAYLGGELYATEWVALSNDVPADLLKKQQALVKATRRLDRLEYKGSRSSYSGQALKHPRNGLQTDESFFYPSGVVVPQLKQAAAELALYYLQTNPAELVEESLRQFKSLHIAGVVNMEMRDNAPSVEDIPDQVMALIYPHLTAGPGMVRLRRA